MRALAKADGRDRFSVDDWVALASVQAAAAPTGVDFDELTHWAHGGGDGRPTTPHGTFAAMIRHQQRKEPYCDACKAFDRVRKRSARERRSEPEPPPNPSLVDEVAVQRACNGEPVKLTKTERKAAVAKLVKRGATCNEMVSLLRMGEDSLKGYLARLLEDEEGMAA